MQKMGAGPAACSLFAMRLLLPLHVNDSFQHLVTYGDDFGVGLEAALGDDHVGKFIGDGNCYERFLQINLSFSCIRSIYRA